MHNKPSGTGWSVPNIIKSILFFILLIVLTGCSYRKSPAEAPSVDIPVTITPVAEPEDKDQPEDPFDEKQTSSGDAVPTEEAISNDVLYSVLNPEGTTLESRILPPKGYDRLPSVAEELTSFLRRMELKPDGSPVLLYDGTEKGYQEGHIAVFDLDTGDRDLQQCADSIIRIYGEYYWSIGAYDKISFHLTNGFLMEYTKWREGYRIVVNGNDVSWKKSKGYDDSYETFRSYLTMVFAYAGTLSLSQECKPIAIDEIRPGDLFLQGGSPGHCVLVVDIAKDSTGRSCFLLAQGYMPAQDFHILKNPLHEEDPWYYEDELTYPLSTPSWSFHEGSLVRWADFPLTGATAASLSDQEVSPSEKRSQVTLLAVGDNLIHIEVVKSGKQKDGSYQFDHLYDNLAKEIRSADLAVVNQETILGGEDFAFSGYPNFNSPYEIGDALVNAGFDVITHATNHTMDMGYQGIKNTFQFWSRYPEITVLGINETKDAQEKIPVLEKNGIKLALLNYTYGLNGYRLPEDKPYLVNLLDKKRMKEDILRAKELSDFIIVFPHWGTEYVYEASSMQKELTSFFYDLGVDLVIGTHPHVLEPVEWIETEPGQRMLVYYSLGNFMSYQKEAPRMLGGMATVTITKEGSETYISEAGITPIVTHYENGPADYHYGIYKLTDYTPEQAKVHGVSEIAVRGAFTYDETYALAKKVLGDWFIE